MVAVEDNSNSVEMKGNYSLLTVGDGTWKIQLFILVKNRLMLSRLTSEKLPNLLLYSMICIKAKTTSLDESSSWTLKNVLYSYHKYFQSSCDKFDR